MEYQIVPGISVTPAGQATIDPSLSDVLFDLAVALEETTDLPVDVQHVVAAIVLASRCGELDSGKPLSSDDPSLAAILTKYVKTLFDDYDGKLGVDD